jgi:hypothetical protein
MIAYRSTNQMLLDDLEIKVREKTAIASLSLEVDNIFLKLRKEHEIIRRESIFLKQESFSLVKVDSITPINEQNFKALIDRMPRGIVDNYISYMLEDESNNIFKVISEYNDYLDKRKKEKQFFSSQGLLDINEKLDDCIRRLGAMIYHLHIHLHIHLNLLIVLIRNASTTTDNQPEALQETQEIVGEYVVNEWGEWQQYSGL